MNGIILINKEKDCTSHDVVRSIKKLTNSKVGHTGTLDPNATGVLPLLLGDATKISKYLINHDKEYEVILQLGKKTTTADIEGEIIEEKEVPEIIFANSIKNEDVIAENGKTDGLLKKDTYIEQVLNSFIGKQKQTPPLYSAIKVNGKKLYDYARQGKEIKIEPRDIEIYNIELLDLNKEKSQIQFKVECSKGTYIRSLCEDIAQKLGTVGYMKELNRTKVGNFYIKDAITISEFEYKLKNNDLSSIITIEQIFKNYKQITLPQQYLKKYINGVNINIDELKEEVKGIKNNPNTELNTDLTQEELELYKIYTNNKFIGLGIVKSKKLKRDIVL